MKDTRKTKTELIAELEILRQRVGAAEEQAARCSGQPSVASSFSPPAPGAAAQTLAATAYLPGILAALHEAAVTICDRNGIVLDAWASSELERVLGLRSADLPGRSVAGFLSRGALADSRERLAEVFDAGRSSRTEYHVDTSTRRIWFEMSFSPLRDRGGKIVAAVVSVRNVTDRKQMVDALQASEERYRSLFNRVPVGLYRSTPDGRFLDANPILAKMFGFESRDEFLACPTTERYLNADDRDLLQKRLRRDGVTYGLELEGRRRDGSAIWIKVSTRAVDGPDGHPQYYEGSIEDVTQRREAQEALRESELRYRTLAESAPDSIFIIGTDDRIRYVNTCGARLLGCTPDGLIGRARSELFPQRDGNRQAESLRRVIETGKPLAAVEQTKVPGRTLWLATRLTPLRDETGQINAVLGIARDVTELKQVEEVLQRERDFASAVLDTARVLVVVLDTAGRIVRVNRTGQQATGRSIDQLRDRFYWDHFVTPEERQEVRNVFERLSSNGLPARHEFHLIDRNGRRRAISWSNSTLPKTDNSIEYVIAVGIDVTERQEAEAALRYRTAFERLLNSTSTRFIHLPAGQVDSAIDHVLRQIGEFAGVDRSYVFRFSDDGQTMSNTHEWCASGIPPAQDRLQQFPASAVPWFTERIRRLEAVYVPCVAELPPEAKAEQREWQLEGIQSLVCVPMVCGGNLIGFVGFDSVRAPKAWPDDLVALLRIVGDKLANALARQEADRALCESEQRFRALFEATFEAVAVHEQSILLDANQAFERLLGCSVADAVGKSVLEFAAPEYRELIAERIRAGDEDPYECEVLRTDGSRVQVELVGKAHVYRGRQVRVVAFRDITERKRTEEALRRADRLTSLGTMVAGVAHELNNPLMAISGLSQILANDAVATPRSQRLAEEIVDQVIRCSRIVEDLLGFARARPVRYQPVKVDELVRKCLAWARRDPRFSQVDIREEYQLDLPAIQADPYRLEQVFINIVGNAGDALKDVQGRRGELRVRIAEHEGELLIELADNGPGLADANKVFDPFYTTKDSGEGTGLGLSVAYGIIEEHGGRITAANLSPGASFSVRLPLVDGSPATESDAAPQSV